MDRQRFCEYVQRLRGLIESRILTYCIQGRVMSFYGPNLEKYTSYRAHPTAEGAVQQLLFTEKGILSISKWSIHFAIRRGLTQWHLTYV